MLDLLTLDEAAAATSLSRDTIKRRLKRGEFPGATRGAAHGRRPPPWLIPMVDLVAAGLEVCLPEPGDRPVAADADVLAVRLARAEATVAARDLHIADLRSEIRLLHDHISQMAARTDPSPQDANARECASAGSAHRSGLLNDRSHHGPQEQHHA